MARIFSWHIQDESKECFAYLAQSGSSGSYVAGSMVLDDKITDSAILNKIANKVSAYTESQYETQFNNMKTKVAQKGFTVQWKDYTYYYNVDGNNLIMLTGIGERGPQGPQGEQGQKGETGSAGKGRNIMCYCGLDSGITPTRENVSGGKFYPNVWDIEYPTDPRGVCTWQDSNEFGLGKVVWMTNADFPNATTDDPNEFVTPITKIDKTGQSYTWATPVQISGPKGDNGADGERIEFVYKRCHTRKEPVPDRPTGTTEEQAERQGWTDHPLGIVGDSDNPQNNWKVEYMSQHIKDDEGNWGEFSDPVLWASWGEDGNDGDGIEYLFAVTQVYDNDAITRTVPNSGMTLALTNGGELRLADIWQEPEVYDYFTYCGVTKTNDGVTVDPNGKYFYGKTGPGDTRHASVYPWTDDPMDVSSGEPYEWVSIRRSKWDITNEHSVYGPFGEPTLWAHWGKDGEKGNDGTSVDIRGQADTLGKLLKSLGNNVPEVGFSYAIGEEGKRVYVWMEQDSSYQVGRTEYKPGQMPTEWYDKPDSEIYPNYYYLKDNKKYWFTDCGSFYGEPGENAYVHEKYAIDYTGQTGVDHRVTPVVFPDGTKDVDLCFTANNGETPGKYFATYTDNVHDDRGDLDFYDGKWVKWMGDDGQSFGQEQIFVRSMSKLDISTFTKVATKNEHGYEIGEEYLNVTYTQDAFTTADWIPGNVGSYTFTDVPLGIVPGQYNFEYVCVRRLVQDGTKDDGTWSYFSVPALYNEAVDTPTFQVEYTKWLGTVKPQLTSANEFTVDGVFDEEAWRANEAQKPTNIQWSDVNDVDTTWMAQCNGYYVNGDPKELRWNDWIVIRCKGFDGKSGTGRNIMAFCSLPEGYEPTQENISGGKFYPNKWAIDFPTDRVGIKPEGLPKRYCSWGDSNEPDDPTYMVWMTNADFPNATGSSESESVDPIVKTDTQGNPYTWSIPVCITGEKGDNGADGESVEFIYFRTSGDTKPDRPDDTSDPDYQKPDFLPRAFINGQYTGERWTDHPDGITELMPFEWMSMRTRDGATGLWGRFSEVSAWSRWGEDGIDGDGVEYIFATGETANDAELLYNSVPKVGDRLALKNGGELVLTEAVWQEPEIYDLFTTCGVTKTNDGVHVAANGKFFFGKTGPNDNVHKSIYPWTDDASDVSPDEPYEYVSIRRKKYTTWEEAGRKIETALYYEFEEPTMWARWSEDGDEVHTSFAFTSRIIGDDISGYKASGFTEDLLPKWTKNGSSVVQDITWSDAPPKTSDIIWMVSGVFRKHHNAKTGEDTWTQDGKWGPITRMVDTENFEVMYSPGKPITGGYDPDDVEPIPTGFTKVGKEINPDWLTNYANPAGWYDEVDEIPTGFGAVWMATIRGSNNVFNDQDWQIFKVKGEKGEYPTDLDYLRHVFGDADVEQHPGAYLREFIGVTSGSTEGSPVVAFLNGSYQTAHGTSDQGTLMIAAGSSSLSTSNSAKFRVYENGDVYARDGHFENGYFEGEVNADRGYFKGEIEANEGKIGGIKIDETGIGTETEDGSFRFGSNGLFNIESKNLQMNNSGFNFFDDSGNPVLTVFNGVYHSLQEFIDSMGGEAIDKPSISPTPIQNSHSEYINPGDSYFYEYVLGSENVPQGIEEPIPLTGVGYDTTFTVPAGAKEKITISARNIDARIGFNGSYINMVQANLSLAFNLDVVDSNGNVVFNCDKFNASTTGNNTFLNLAENVSYTTILGEGTYHLQLSPFKMYENMSRLQYSARLTVTNSNPDYSHGGSQCNITTYLAFNDLKISGIPQASGMEIFTNGIGVKNSTKDYFFIATPVPNGVDSLTMSARSNNAGFDFSGGTWTWKGLTPH